MYICVITNICYDCFSCFEDGGSRFPEILIFFYYTTSYNALQLQTLITSFKNKRLSFGVFYTLFKKTHVYRLM